MTLTMDGYDRMSPAHRDQFHDWLKRVGLADRWVVQGTFGEGFITVERAVKGDDGQAILDASGEDLVTTLETVPLIEPPPSFVAGYCDFG